MRVEKWRRRDGASKGWVVYPHDYCDTCPHIIEVYWMNVINGATGRRIWLGPQFKWGTDVTPIQRATTEDFLEGLKHALTLTEPDPDDPPPELG